MVSLPWGILSLMWWQLAGVRLPYTGWLTTLYFLKTNLCENIFLKTKKAIYCSENKRTSNLLLLIQRNNAIYCFENKSICKDRRATANPTHNFLLKKTLKTSLLLFYTFSILESDKNSIKQVLPFQVRWSCV